jgi:hypothetical protein
MSEGAGSDAVATPRAMPPATCANCGATLHGHFCAACGQESKPLDPPVRQFVGELAQEFFDVDGRLLRSLRRLLMSPGFLTREHVEGRRIPWLSPLKLYVLASVVMFSLQALAGTFSEIRLTKPEDVSAVTSKLQEMGYASVAELQRAIETARLTWTPRVMFVLVPLFAGLVALVERRARRRYPSHFVFALHVHAAAFFVRGLADGAAMAAPAGWRPGLERVANLYILVYAFLAFRSAYGASRARAAVDTAVAGTVYVVALVSAVLVIVTVAMFGHQWLASWGF